MLTVSGIEGGSSDCRLFHERIHTDAAGELSNEHLPCPWERRMHMKEKELMEYLETTKKTEYAGQNVRKDWMFGAIEFAFKSGMINQETFETLLHEYEII